METTEKILHPILDNEQIFGVNLYEAGLAQMVCEYFTNMIQGLGSVRKTLEMQKMI